MPVYPKVDAGVDVSDADAAVGDVKESKTFYSVAEPRKTGTLPTKTLSAANETVEAGYYAATTLSAVDVDLAVGNIKKDVNIFGKVGTLVPSFTEVRWNKSIVISSLPENYATVTTDVIPDTATRVFVLLATIAQAADRGWSRVAYNGVERIAEFRAGSINPEMFYWEGAGVGAAANLVFEAKRDAPGDDQLRYWILIGYIT